VLDIFFESAIVLGMKINIVIRPVKIGGGFMVCDRKCPQLNKFTPFCNLFKSWLSASYRDRPLVCTSCHHITEDMKENIH